MAKDQVESAYRRPVAKGQVAVGLGYNGVKVMNISLSSSPTYLRANIGLTSMINCK